MPGVPDPDPQRYTRLPTAPVSVQRESGPQPDETGFTAQDHDWQPSDSTSTPTSRVRREPQLAPWALLSAIVALFASLFVGWGIPVAIVSVIAAIMSLRRPEESRALSVWALVLGLVAVLYSVGWLLWAAFRFGWLG